MVGYRAKGRGMRDVVLLGGVALGVVALVGCGGSGGGSGSGGGGGGTPPPEVGAKSIYVLEGSSGLSSSILQFAVGSEGNATPIATLAMPANFVNMSVATDSSGQIYVGGGVNFIFEILVYPAGSNGSTVPTRTITLGAFTDAGTIAPDSLTVDSSGNIYEADYLGPVGVYGPTANGAAVPTQRITSSVLTNPTGLAADKAGNLYVANEPPTGTAGGTIYVFAPGSTGDAAPSRTITLSEDPYGIAVDSSGNIYVGEITVVAAGNGTVTSASSQIVEFSSTATGAATPTKSVNIPSGGDPLVLVFGLTVDNADNIFAAVDMYATASSGPIESGVLEFGPSASGSATPITNFTSSSWSYANPYTLAVE